MKGNVKKSRDKTEIKQQQLIKRQYSPPPDDCQHSFLIAKSRILLALLVLQLLGTNIQDEKSPFQRHADLIKTKKEI